MKIWKHEFEKGLRGYTTASNLSIQIDGKDPIQTTEHEVTEEDKKTLIENPHFDLKKDPTQKHSVIVKLPKPVSK